MKEIGLFIAGGGLFVLGLGIFFTGLSRRYRETVRWGKGQGGPRMSRFAMTIFGVPFVTGGICLIIVGTDHEPPILFMVLLVVSSLCFPFAYFYDAFWGPDA